MFQAHYQEIARYKDIQLDPDLWFYARLEETGGLRVYSARADGALIGYIIFIVRTNPHYRASLHAHQDILFLLPAYRKGMTGIRLIRYADEQLRAEGVQVVTQHVKDYADFGPVLERLGYEKIETTWAKRLDV